MTRHDNGQNSRRNIKLWMDMVNTTRKIQSDLRDNLRSEFGWTLPKFQVMAMLANHETSMTLSALASSLLLSNANVSVMVERLVQDGMVERINDKSDRRAIKLTMTTKGHQEFTNIMENYQIWVSQYFNKLDEEESKMMFALLAKLA